jgi:Tfp pilus assembly major pilin PilA
VKDQPYLDGFIGIFAAISIPAYLDYTVRAQLTAAAIASTGARQHLAEYYIEHRKIPASLGDAGVAGELADGTVLSMDPNGMQLTVHSKAGDLVFTPITDPRGQIVWRCRGAANLKTSQLPAGCR